MTTPLPSLTDYNHALDNPKRAFAGDPVLAAGVPDRDGLGDPVSATGGFAITYQIVSDGTRYAVRCFHKQVGGPSDQKLTQRYDAIARFIRRNQSHRFLVDVAYNPQGISVDGLEFPTVRMPFVDGDPLGYWVEDNAGDPQALNAVREQINNMVRSLASLGAAHGDLQHGNIMVGDDNSVRLIDYDGLYLPELAPLGALDAGHINYQHPGRNGAYDAGIDHFAAYVIDLSLDAIARDTKLWNDFGDSGDKLLFDASDFAAPDKSKVLARLAAMPPAVAKKAGRLKAACLTDYENVARALAGASVAPRKAPTKKAAAHVFLEATEVAELRRREGQQVTVHGRITATKYIWDKQVALINFGDFRQAAFTIVAFGDAAESLRELHGFNLNELVGQTVTMTGYLRLYWSSYSGLPTPQFQLQRVGQMRLQGHITGASSSASMSAPPTTSSSGPTASTSSGSRPPTSPRGPGNARPSTASPKSSRPTGTSTGTGRRTSAQGSTASSGRTTDWQWAYPPPPPPPKFSRSTSYDSPYTPVYRPSHRVGSPSAPPSPPPPPSSYRPPYAAPQPRRRKSRRQTIIAIAIILVFLYLVGRCAVAIDNSDHRAKQAAPTSAPVAFQSPSRNLGCRIIPDGPAASVRCDARTIHYTPPPRPPDCSDPSYGHAIGFAANAGPAAFMCVTDSLINASLPIVEYGGSTHAGPFSCTSSVDGITCRDNRNGHGLHIERDNYQLF